MKAPAAHGTTRGARPDAEVGSKLYLLKNVSVLHATYQIRLLAFRAQQEGKQLVIRGPARLELGPSLERLVADSPGTILVERSDN